MSNEFTAIIERDGEWFIAYSPEIPSANGQGKTANEAKTNLAEAIKLILGRSAGRRGERGALADAIRDMVVIR